MTNDKQREWREGLQTLNVDGVEIAVDFLGKDIGTQTELHEALVNFIEALLDKTRKEVAKEILSDLKVRAESYLEDDTTIYEAIVLELEEYLKD